MRARKLGALPVVRGEELLGLVTEADLLAALEELLGG
jgi:CBS domain-containing protein